MSLEFIPPVIAHRGASAYAPENTLAAFVKAVQLGVRWVEFDVMSAACGEAIIFHDDLLDRTTDGKGEVNTYTYQYLRQLDAGRWFHHQFSGERILTFEQLIIFLAEMNINANVEIKALPRHETALIIRILEILNHLTISLPTILFSSFSISALEILRERAPEARLGLLLHEWEPNWKKICHDLNCVSVHVNEEIMTKEAAQQIKGMNKKLLCYTVNDPKRALKLFKYGVDAVFSDAPDRIINIKNTLKTIN